MVPDLTDQTKKFKLGDMVQFTVHTGIYEAEAAHVRDTCEQKMAIDNPLRIFPQGLSGPNYDLQVERADLLHYLDPHSKEMSWRVVLMGPIVRIGK